MTIKTPARDSLVVHADPSEERVIRELDELLDAILRRGSRSAKLVSSEGDEVEIPPSAFQALQLVVEGMAQGKSMALIPRGEELTTQQAADILHVSRPHLVDLLEERVIPHHKVGTHRRVRIEDVLSYQASRGGRRRELLKELTRLSEEAKGGYE